MSDGKELGMEPVSTSVSPPVMTSSRPRSSSTFFSEILGPMPLHIVMTMPLSFTLMRVNPESRQTKLDEMPFSWSLWSR